MPVWRVAERPTFESEVSKRIYEYVERHGTANRHIVQQTVSAPAEEFERELDRLESRGYLNDVHESFALVSRSERVAF